ncbi:MAG: orotidine 5'-phosphate decarboxylase / HUMPS family protein [Aerococcus sp.]|nr:orotidine 5'-phosphate decarboxylase / HUMPS family protein [Aerococcus sp.]
MKLQVAIDRVSLDRAIELAHQLDPFVDIIEFGTSLVKDYGLITLREYSLHLKHAEWLIDLKTNDEGTYEFKQGYTTEAAILTVMAASSYETIQQVYAVSEELNKDVLIDLLEATQEQIDRLTVFEHAIFGLHHSKDAGGDFDAVDTVAQFHQDFPQVKRVAVAGGIDLEQVRKLRQQGIVETVIVGGKIIGTDDPVATAKQFMEVLK